MPTLSLRPATTTDASIIAALLTELGHPTSATDVPSRLDALLAAGGAVLVAEAEGAAAPVALMSLTTISSLTASGPVAYITSLVVTERWHGHGVGRTLVDAAFRWAQERCCARLTVTSAEHRADAHAFYPRCGLPYTGRRFSTSLEQPQR